MPQSTARHGGKQSGVPLDLAPILSPHKRHQRLSLRVEQLPPQARLSNGCNNGERTWSLNPDELDDLFYLPPKGLKEPHTLAIRVLSLDDDAAKTLALVDITVVPPVDESDDPDDVSADRRVPASHLSDDLAAAKAAWQAETERRIAEALDKAQREAAAKLAESEAAWLDESGKLLAEAEARLRDKAEARLRDEAEQRGTAAKRAADEAAETTQRLDQATTARLAEVRAECERGFEQRLEDALGKAEREAAAKLAESEAAWREESGMHLAETETRLREEAEQRSTAERAADQVAETNQQLDQASTKRLAEVRAECERGFERRLAEALDKADREAAAALAKAEAAWRQESGMHLAETETRLREEAEQFGIAERAAGEAAEAAKAELQQSLNEISMALEQAEARAQAAETAVQEASDQRAADATRLEKAETATDEIRAETRAEIEEEIARLRHEITAAETAHAIDIEEARRAAQEAADAAHAREIEQLKESHADALEQQAAEIKQRLDQESTERLAEVRAECERGFEERMEEALRQAREEAEQSLAEVREEAEARLAEAARAATDPAVAAKLAARLPAAKGARGNGARWQVRKIALYCRRALAAPGGIRKGAIAASVVAALLLYPVVKQTVVESLGLETAELDGGFKPLLEKTASTLKARLSELTPVITARAFVDVKYANVRASPTTTAATVTVLNRDKEVTLIERQGDWLRVQYGDGDDKFGWVHAALLRR